MSDDTNMPTKFTPKRLRYSLLSVAVLVSVLVIVSSLIGRHTIQAQHAFANYSYAINTMLEALLRTELDLLVETRDVDSAYYHDAEASFSEGLRIFAAIRSVDPDGGADDDISEDEDDYSAVIEGVLETNEFDLQVTARQYGLGDEMPAALASLWEQEDEAAHDGKESNASDGPGGTGQLSQTGRPLETLVGEVITLAAPIFSVPLSPEERSVRIRQFQALMRTSVEPKTFETVATLRRLTRESQTWSQSVLLIIAIAGLGVVGFIVLGVFLPLEKQVTQDRENIEAARQKAEAADHAKSEFLANMSHEIRTPMNGVLGMAELLFMSELNATQKNYANTILQSGNALLTIINDILDFSKINDGKLELEDEPFNLRDLVDDVTALVAPTANEKKVDIVSRVHPRLPKQFVGDGGRVRQVLLNLVGNAVKFTQEGHVSINISGVEQSGRASITVQVDDTGIGIPKDRLNTIFDKFNQVDNTGSREFEGTGLGLTICQMLIEKMGGSIKVESELGRGSTFSFELDLPVHLTDEKEKGFPAEIRDNFVLIIDADPQTRASTIEILGSWGSDAAACATIEDAHSLINRTKDEMRKPALTILDLNVGEEEGLNFIRNLRLDEEPFEFPVIATTVASSSLSQADILQAGGQRLITKPISSSLLFDSIVEVFSEALVSSLKGFTYTTTSPSVISVNDDTGQPEVHRPPFVLVVEDNLVNQKVIGSYLDSLGVAYLFAGDGLKALNMLATHQPTLIFMDMSMPIMSGIDATAEIRRREKALGRHVPIVGLTANAIKGDREKCLAAGMDDYLSKPIDLAKLQACLQTWMPDETDRFADKGRR